MSDAVRQLEPKLLWNHFADLNAVPRASKKEERVIAFMKDFGERHNLETVVDAVGNVIIRKPATAGMENRVPIVMQSHLDMVHQKNAATDFDFETEGIRMLVDGDWVKAEGTTLGADNGLGVATIMTLLATDEFAHPPLEALFTIDEETGMTGAQGLQGGMLRGEIMLNLDTEEDNELTIGCAGGVDVTATHSYSAEHVPADWQGLRLSVRGLKGGHSGMDIHLGLGNANKIMNRILHHLVDKAGIRVATIDGGGLRNAIPRESFAEVMVPSDQLAKVHETVATLTSTIRNEYNSTDPELEVTCEPLETPPESVLPGDLQEKLLATIYACPCGIYRMSPDIPDLVQTSNNLARVLAKDGEIKILCLTRSSVNSERDDLARAICANFSLIGGTCEAAGAYPGWQPAPGSPIVALMSELYQEMFGEPAHVAACHAGLECGIVGQNYPEMQMISFGPTIRGAHSPDERASISSTQKYWDFLTETLKRIPLAA